MWYRTLLFTVGISLLLLAGGCAKYPSGGSSTSGPQLVVTMTFAQPINTNYFYYVVFDVSNDSAASNGPVPVIAPPWGNGFCTSQTPPGNTPNNPGGTSFVQYYGSTSVANSNGYALYNFTPGTNLVGTSLIGAPIQASAPGQAGASANTLQFTVLLSQLATSSIPASSIQFIQINAIATDAVITNPTSTGPKNFDALNDSSHSVLSDYITISTIQSGSYSVNCTGVPQTTTGTNTTVSNNNPNVQSLQITNLNVQVVR